MKTVVLKVDGMTCKNCVKNVENTLKAVDGVKSVKVDLAKGEAVVECMPYVRDVELVSDVLVAGYPAEVEVDYSLEKAQADAAARLGKN